MRSFRARYPRVLVSFSLLLGVFASVPAASSATAPAPPSLGSAGGYAMLGGPAVTCTDSTVIGDIGSGFGGAPVTQTNCPVTGAVHRGDAAAQQAYTDFRLAYLAFAKLACPSEPAANLSGTLANVTLPPGVYCFAAAAALTGTLTLDAQGATDPLWIFKVGGNPVAPAALTATNFSVVFANFPNATSLCSGVYWWVNSAATFTSTSFAGTILSGAGITFTGVGHFLGNALATEAVTVSTESSFGSCTHPDTTPPTSPPPHITLSGLCVKTKQFIQSSPRYLHLSLVQQHIADLYATALCQGLASITPTLTAAKLAAVVRAYDLGVQALVPLGWLTQPQATTLIGLASTL